MKDDDIAHETRFSLVEDPLLRILRALRIVPKDGLGARRRAIFLVVVTFVPILVWGLATGHIPPGEWTDPLLRHLGVVSRALFGFPLFILTEPVAERVIRLMIANFIHAGIVRGEEREPFLGVLRSVERLRDSWFAWLVMIGLVVLSVIVSARPGTEDPDALIWARDLTTIDFGGQWAIFVVRPLFLFLLLVWLWRLTLCAVLFRRIAKLELRLVASHPDKMGGLGFLESFPVAFSGVILAISIVLCSFIGHQIHSHGARVADFQVHLVSIAVVLAVLFLAPLAAFSRPLRRCRLRARFQYGTLAGRFVHGLHARWIDGEQIPDDPVLEAPEIGPAADVQTLYAMGTSMQAVPIGKRALIAALLPVVAPMLLVVSMEVPLKDVLLKILGAIA